MSILQKSNKKASARQQINIKGVKDGVLMLPRNQYRVVYEVSSINFELKSEDEQDALIDTYESFLNSLPCPLQSLLPKIAVALIVTAIVWIMAALIIKMIRVRHLTRRKIVFLELTPPAQVDKTREATQRLFSVLHGLKEGRATLDKALGHNVVLSLEVLATREKGIRYVASGAEADIVNLEQTIAAYVPEARIRRIEKPNSPAGRLIEVKQSGHFAYPLHDHVSYDQHDPMAFLTGAMTKLASGEAMSFQMVVSPVKVREAGVIAKRIFHNEELLYQLGRRRVPLIGRLFGVIDSILFSILDSIGEGISSTHKSYKTQHAAEQHRQQAAMKIKPARTLSVFEQELAEAVNNKLNQSLFRVTFARL